MKKWLRAYLEVPFRMLAVLVGIFQANRNWMAARMASPKAAATFQMAIIATFAVWIAVWLLSGDADQSRLSDAVKSLWSSVGTSLDAPVK